MNEVWGRCAEEVSLDLTGSFWTNLLPRVKNEATIKVFASQASEESDWETTAYGLSKRLVSRSSFRARRSLTANCNAYGGVAKWLCSGLQSRPRRFDSGLRLQTQALNADSGLFCVCPAPERNAGRHGV